MADLIERELELDIALADAWQAITDPERLSVWLADEVEIELEPGGAARFCSGSEEREGWVEAIDPPGPDEREPARLVFWWSAGSEPASRVELVLEPLPDERVRLRVAETRPLELLDVVGIPLPGSDQRSNYGPSLVAA
jgi:uncharacterized protein YndB with AHSA1/START domain